MRHSPFHTLLFLVAVFALMAGVAAIFPEKGLNAGRLALTFPQLNSFFSKPEVKKTDISQILALAEAEEKVIEEKKDSLIVIDSAAIKKIEDKDSTIKLITSIQYKNTSKSALSNFFSSLKNLPNEAKSIRVLHYGDSQIEGDRITDYLRLRLQMQFGGEGPGLISLMPVTQSVINWISWSDGWDRYGVFSYRDKRVKHDNFGVMANFCRYRDYKSVTDTAGRNKKAWIKITTTMNGGAKAASYNKLKLFYGGARTKVLCEFYDGGVLKETDSLAKGGNFNVKEYNVSSLNHEFRFAGADSPDFYGASLEGGKGIIVDNLGLRGSSGTFFHQINASQLKQFYEYLNVRLIILQFGGNTLPYLKDKEMADNFGGYIKAQIYNIRKAAPQASILIIGPADMSVKEGTEYVTHPLLEDLRNAMKKAAFDTDCAFFDMYDCMGGKNSMVSWVEQNIAAKDYIHFSPKGAKKIATLLYSSLINDYNAYSKSDQKK